MRWKGRLPEDSHYGPRRDRENPTYSRGYLPPPPTELERAIRIVPSSGSPPWMPPVLRTGTEVLGKLSEYKGQRMTRQTPRLSPRQLSTNNKPLIRVDNADRRLGPYLSSLHISSVLPEGIYPISPIYSTSFRRKGTYEAGIANRKVNPAETANPTVVPPVRAG
jgi:hypothetical protein